MTERQEDDLFTPSLAGGRRAVPAAGRRPWRLGSQFYVAVFGGPIAAGLVGYLNGKRLGLPPRRLAAVAGIAAAALVAVAIVAAVVAANANEDRPLRLVSMVGGAAAYVGIRQLQKDADRRYGVGRSEDESYDSLWLPGLGIALVGGIVAGIVILSVTA
jgi:peptidoglycan/LPS O-acetylase OafA/YrhL